MWGAKPLEMQSDLNMNKDEGNLSTPCTGRHSD